MKTFFISIIALFVCLIPVEQPAEGAIKEEVSGEDMVALAKKLKLHSATAEYYQLLIKRIESNRRSSEEDSLDMVELLDAMDKFGFTFEDYKVSREEFIRLGKGVVLKSFRKLSSDLKHADLHPLDREIGEKQLEDILKLAPYFGITREEVESISKEK